MTPDASHERPGRPPSSPSQEDIQAPYNKGRVTASPRQGPARTKASSHQAGSHLRSRSCSLGQVFRPI